MSKVDCSPGLPCNGPGDSDLAFLLLHLGLQGPKDCQGWTSQQHLDKLSPVQTPVCSYTFVLILGGLIGAHIGDDYKGVAGAGAQPGQGQVL